MVSLIVDPNGADPHLGVCALSGGALCALMFPCQGVVASFRLLKALTESAGEFTFDEGREVELKGISGPQTVHAVEWDRG